MDASFFDKDVFGDTTVVAQGQGDAGATLRIETGSEWDNPVMAFLIAIAGPVQAMHLAEVFHRDPQGDVSRADALFAASDDKYGLAINTDPDFLSDVTEVKIGAIWGSSTAVQVKSGKRDFHNADTFTARGSTAGGTASAEKILKR